MADSIASALLATGERSAELISGTVVDSDATTLTLLIRGTSTPSAYLTAYKPRIGDLVAVLRQDSTLITLGALSGVGPNMVNNFSFEDGGADDVMPPGWTEANISGTASVSTVISGFAPAGDVELSVSSGETASDTYVYSDPIPVNPGEVWALSVLAAAVYQPNAIPDAKAAIYGLWFANNTALYPTTAAADTLAAQVDALGEAPGHTPVSGTVTVPAAATMLRVATRSITAAGTTVLWDAVIARRVS